MCHSACRSVYYSVERGVLSRGACGECVVVCIEVRVTVRVVACGEMVAGACGACGAVCVGVR